MLQIQVMPDDAQAMENSLPIKRARNSPKHSQATWMEARLRYESGLWLTIREIADEFNIKYQTFYTRLKLEKWDVKRQEILEKAQSKVEKNTLKEVDRQENYRLRLSLRAEKYERMLDASVSQQSTNNEGVPQCDPEQLDTLTRAELRVVEMNKVGLMIAPPSIDVTGNVSVAVSIVQAIQKLRDSNTAIDLTPEQVKLIGSLEVVD